ncbi:MAG: Crp/Fnr family transcriptional regulator, partial [Thermomonas sp.]
VEPVSWVAASGAATVAAMTREDALALLEMEGMGLRAARWLARKLAETWAWNRLVGVHPVMARVCACLLWLKKEDGTLALPTHAELGWRLNTTRESVTRALQRLQQDGIVQRCGERWRITDEPALQALALFRQETETLRQTLAQRDASLAQAQRAAGEREEQWCAAAEEERRARAQV